MLRYEAFEAGGPTHTASSAINTGRLFSSAVEWTTTVFTPISRAVRMTRRAISPRLAIRIFLNTAFSPQLSAFS